MEKATGQKYRDACDQCHIRKIKCISDQKGACFGCRNNARRCVFSPRDEMGRPKRAGRSKTGSIKESADPFQAVDDKRLSPSREVNVSSSSASDSTRSVKSKSTAASSMEDNDVHVTKNMGSNTRGHELDAHSSVTEFPADKIRGQSTIRGLQRSQSEISPSQLTLQKAHHIEISSSDIFMNDVEMQTPPNENSTYMKDSLWDPDHVSSHGDNSETDATLKTRLEMYLRPYQLLSGLMSMELGPSTDLHALCQAISDICDFVETPFLVSAQGQSIADDQKRRTCVMLVAALPILLEVGKSLQPRVVEKARARSISGAGRMDTQSQRGQSQLSDITGSTSYSFMYEDFQDLVDKGTQLMMVDFQLARLGRLLDHMNTSELVTHFLTGTKQQRQNLDSLRASLQESSQALQMGDPS